MSLYAASFRRGYSQIREPNTAVEEGWKTANLNGC
jgi:hypothetical protein